MPGRELMHEAREPTGKPRSTLVYALTRISAYPLPRYYSGYVPATRRWIIERRKVGQHRVVTAGASAFASGTYSRRLGYLHRL